MAKTPKKGMAKTPKKPSRRELVGNSKIEINPDLSAAYKWNVYGDNGVLLWTVNADNLLVTGDGALNFVANIGGTTVSVFATNAIAGPMGTYRWAQKV